VDIKALRRAHAWRESGGFLLLPLLYFVLMLAGLLSYEPSLALLTLGFVFMLVMQTRSSAAAAAVGPPPRGKKGSGWEREAVSAADRRFLRQVVITALTNAGAYLVFIVALDVHLRAAAAGIAPGYTLLAGAAAAIALALLGRTAARRAAWSGFAALHPALWGAQDGLNVGRTARSPATYLAWREGAHGERGGT
jgi:hypothetical protein